MKEIQLTQGKVAIVDDEDFERLSSFKWYFQKAKDAGRARRRISGSGNRATFMHREIMNAPPHLQVDHINGNSLDNRKQNLRLCTNSQNTMNARPRLSVGRKYKGITWHKPSRKWRALITHNKKQIYLGQYDKPEDAAKAYDRAAPIYFGAYARTNF